MKKLTFVIFTYNRPKHLLKSLRSLSKCKDYNKTPFTIIIDKADDNKIINAYKTLLRKLPKNFNFVIRKKRLGLKKNIKKGLTELSRNNKYLIVGEDDLIYHKDFIIYMKKNLKRYENVKKIAAISGFSYIDNNFLNRVEGQYAAQLTPTWGWATWSNRWKLFINTDLNNQKKILFSNKNLLKRFDYDGVQNHSAWLKLDEKKIISSWNIEWELFCFFKKKLSLYPRYTMTKNIGFDGSGTHHKKTNYNYQSLRKKMNLLELNYSKKIRKDEDLIARELIKQKISVSIIKKKIVDFRRFLKL